MTGRFLPLLYLSVLLAGAEEAVTHTPTPYEADAFTLHLWHLDEDAPPFHDAGLSPTPLLGLLNHAKAGQAALPELGQSVSFHHNVGGTPGQWDLRGAILTIAPSLSNGPADRAPESFRYFGQNGAFTYEALVKLDLRPEEAEVIALGIISMDGEDRGERIFNFRIERQGFLAFTPLEDSGSKGGAIATLPLTGPHALNTNDWFHVAVTYSGQEDTPNNLRLYWTRIGSQATAANLVGAGILSHDFNGHRGDFAIGNEARTSHSSNAEGEPFPGCIDEVRISSVARHPSDFLFVPPDRRTSPSEAEADEISSRQGSPQRIELANVLVDGEKEILPSSEGRPMILPPGLHRIDFDLNFSPEQMARPVKLRTQLKGADDTWRKALQGMNLFFDVLDAEGRVISQARSEAIGSSFGWANRVDESEFAERSEPLFLPPEAAALRITLDSGSPDTTGTFVIDDLEVLLPGTKEIPIWPNSGFSRGVNLRSAAGVPEGWTRGGSDPAIAQLALPESRRSLAVIDGDQQHSGNWSAMLLLDPTRHSGRTVATRWKEVYNVIPGSVHRASYVNVPAGAYTFRAVWLSDGESVTSGGVELPIEIRLPVWERVWFWPLVTFGAVALVAFIIIREVRRINRRKLRRLWMENALERDRSRIARDMHDDLGTRVSVLNINAALVGHELDRNPNKARKHLDKLATSARELVIAMKDLVWSVDPSHDSLEHLATHLTQLAEELYADGPVRYSLDIPSSFPDQVLGSDFRHHISLAVKEALNNALKHADPSEVYLSMSCEDATLDIEVRDNGCGFDTDQLDPSRHGLRNLVARLEELGGICKISSSPGQGTRVLFSCPIVQESVSTAP